MDAKESAQAAAEARAEVTRPGRRSRHTDAALKYLRDIMYIEAHRREPRHEEREKPESRD